jgi:glycosyltransferase involved in cell wall biosynthesis
VAAVPVSLLVATLNEEANLAACLTSCAWTDEVFVVDSFSSDSTVEIARRYTPNVVQHEFVDYSSQKNWALDNLPFRNEWVLILDADECATPDLAHEISTIVSDPTHRFDGYYVNRRFIFLGNWIRHAGWYPSWNLRLFRHRKGRYDGRAVHEHLIVDGPVSYLRNDLIHEDRKGLYAFIDRHNRYSTYEAKSRLTAGIRSPLSFGQLANPVHRKRILRERVWPRVPLKPIVMFLYMYVLRQGFRDGYAGFAFCCFQMYQEFCVGLKMRELRRIMS